MADSGNADMTDDDGDLPLPPPEKVRKLASPPEEPVRFYPTYGAATPSGWVAMQPMHMAQMPAQFYASRPPDMVPQAFPGAFPVDIGQPGPAVWQRPWADGSLPPDALIVQPKGGMALPPINAVIGAGPQFAPAPTAAPAAASSSSSSRRKSATPAAPSSSTSDTAALPTRRRRSPPSK
jgi:hypothetical protein